MCLCIIQEYNRNIDHLTSTGKITYEQRIAFLKSMDKGLGLLISKPDAEKQEIPRRKRHAKDLR
jgi:hypothetical protein